MTRSYQSLKRCLHSLNDRETRPRSIEITRRQALLVSIIQASEIRRCRKFRTKIGKSKLAGTNSKLAQTTRLQLVGDFNPSSRASIYTRWRSGQWQYLDDLEVDCPYCSTRNSRETVSRSNQVGSSLASFFSLARIWAKETRSFHISCHLCRRKYDIVIMSDHEWLKSRISYADVVLQQIATTFPNEDNAMDMIFANITGIAKADKEVIHICFKSANRRFYLSCSKENGQMQAYMLSEVSL